MPNLYHVQADDPQGENLDWFISAHDPLNAVFLWQMECENNGFDPSDGITRMRFIPTNLTDDGPRAIAWTELPIVIDKDETDG